jgi:endonuclease/exonuclease/phosphatase (EEP) superfamily protein YafD
MINSKQIRKTKQSSNLDKIIVLLALMTSLASNSAWLSDMISQLDLLVHFQVQYAWAIAIFTIALIYRRKFFWAIIIALLLIPILTRIIPLYVVDTDTSLEPKISLLSSNIGYTNINYSSLIDVTKRIQPDVLIVQEATDDCSKALTELHSIYPYRVLQPEPGAKGMLMLSKKPLLNSKVVIHPLTKHVTISAHIKLGDSLLHLVAAHPFRPGLRHGTHILENELGAISKLILKNKSNTIVIGDLNTTMWSNVYKDFVNKCELSNLRQGRGVMASWNRFIPWLSAIPIDHCLVGENLVGENFELLPIKGADHCAMRAVIKFAD